MTREGGLERGETYGQGEGGRKGRMDGCTHSWGNDWRRWIGWASGRALEAGHREIRRNGDGWMDTGLERWMDSWMDGQQGQVIKLMVPQMGNNSKTNQMGVFMHLPCHTLREQHTRKPSTFHIYIHIIHNNGPKMLWLTCQASSWPCNFGGDSPFKCA